MTNKANKGGADLFKTQIQSMLKNRPDARQGKASSKAYFSQLKN